MIKVVLVEDMRLMRGALAALLEHDPDIAVVDSFGGETAVVPRAVELRPDVVVIKTDVAVGRALVTATEVEKIASVPCHSLVIFDPRRPVLLPTENGARPPSFVAQDAPPAALATAVRRVAGGELVTDPRVVVTALTVGESPLTRRELEVLALAADGVPVAEIADRLSLSRGTVRNYLSATIAKTKARSRIDAIRIARA